MADPLDPSGTSSRLGVDGFGKCPILLQDRDEIGTSTASPRTVPECLGELLHLARLPPEESADAEDCVPEASAFTSSGP